MEVGLFTSPGDNSYWNHTYFILVEHPSGYLVKYAELGSIRVKKGEWVLAGQTLGAVGQVISPERVDDSAPGYIQQLVREHLTSMLHLEVFLPELEMPDEYRGGNLFSPGCPEGLLDPSVLLAGGDENKT